MYKIFDECHDFVARLVAPEEEGVLDSLDQLGLLLPELANGANGLRFLLHNKLFQQRTPRKLISIANRARTELLLPLFSRLRTVLRNLAVWTLLLVCARYHWLLHLHCLG